MTELPRVRALLEGEFERGAISCAQVAVSHRAKAMTTAALGVTRSGGAANDATLLPLLCTGKILTTSAYLRLWSDGGPGPYTRLAAVLPWCDGSSVGGFTIAELLAHMTGIRPDPCFGRLWDGQVALRDAYLGIGVTGDPRSRVVSYSPVWASAVMADLIEFVADKPYWTYLQDVVLSPLGALSDFRFALDERQVRLAEANCAELHEFRDGKLREPTVMVFPAQWQAHNAGIGIVGTARSLCTLMSTLADDLVSGTGRIVPDGYLAAATRPWRAPAVDPAHGHVVVDWGLGFNVDAHYFSDCSSFGTFGHRGFSSSVALADPTNDLAIGIIVNGLLSDEESTTRARRLVGAVYEDLRVGAGSATAGNASGSDAESAPRPSPTTDIVGMPDKFR